MMINCEKLAQIATTNAPATREEIEQAQQVLGGGFPREYVELLQCSNGLMVPQVASLILYSTEEIEERNVTYAVQTYAPSWLLIGDDGGGQGIFLDRADLHSAVYWLGLGVGDPSHAVLLAPTLAEWIESGFDLKEPAEDSYPKVVDVWLVRVPADGAKALLRLKQELALTTSIGELYRGLEHLPYRLLRAVPFWKYAILCARYNIMDACLGLFMVDRPDCPVENPLVGQALTR
jgi:hypothetical protein